MTITLTTETGRTISISIETARTLEAVGCDAGQIDNDIDGLIAGKSPGALFLFCLDGGDGQESEWSEYVAACRDAAEGEARLYAAARAHVADVLSMGHLTAEQIATDAAPLETWDRASIGEAVGLPDDASDEQIDAGRALLANSIRLAARQVQA